MMSVFVLWGKVGGHRGAVGKQASVSLRLSFPGFGACALAMDLEVILNKVGSCESARRPVRTTFETAKGKAASLDEWTRRR